MALLKIHIIVSIIIYMICLGIGYITVKRVRAKHSDFKSRRTLPARVKIEAINALKSFIPGLNVFILVFCVWLSTKATDEIYQMKCK